MNIKIFKKILIFLLIPIAILSNHHINKKDYQINPQLQEPSIKRLSNASFTSLEATLTTIPLKERIITVWVHGTRMISQRLFPNFFRTIPGLQPAILYTTKNNLFTIAKTLQESNPKNFPLEDIFIFGWNGNLNYSDRFDASFELYHQLILLIEKYEKQYKTKPKIRLITHSHGGNVSLYLATIEKIQKKNLIIDELILLACPVQRETSNLIKNKIFKKIYSLYSTLDFIQRADPQGLYEAKKKFINKINKKNSQKKQTSKEENTPFFSEQIFNKQENLKQIEIKINGRPILHSEFILKHFIKRLPKILY